jgi:16S rRNA (guanine527-N7)-methyltransferase
MDSIARELDTQLRELLPAAAVWGLRLGPIEHERLTRFALELLRWNEQVNLTRITAPREVVIRHFLDSLSCAQAFETPPETLIDVGTGAGFPGIPLKIVWPDLVLTLTDSTAKKTAFLDHVVDVLGLREVTVVTARAETLGRAPRHRERYAAVVARAVAALPVLSEYCLPLCRVGGRFVAPKGSDGAAEATAAEGAIGQLGGRVHAIMPIELPEVEPRTLVVVDKVSATPAGLPRAIGIPTKRPL